MSDDVAQREVDWVSELAEHDARLQGIVAHASLERPGEVVPHLEFLATNPLVKGVRRLIQGEQDPTFCIHPDFVEGVRLLASFGFSFDICVFHHQLPAVLQLVEKCPDVSFILDHMGKPGIRERTVQPWKDHIRALSQAENVVCKISGLITEADHSFWKPADCWPYIDHAFDVFGPERILFGSDWPVVKLAGSFRHWTDVLLDITRAFSDEEKAALYHNNAATAYRLHE